MSAANGSPRRTWHTPGRVAVDGHCVVSVNRSNDDFGRMCVADCSDDGWQDAHGHEVSDREQTANARRIAALWNAAERLPTNLIDDGLIQNLIAAAAQARDCLQGKGTDADRIKILGELEHLLAQIS